MFGHIFWSSVLTKLRILACSPGPQVDEQSDQSLQSDVVQPKHKDNLITLVQYNIYIFTSKINTHQSFQM